VSAAMKVEFVDAVGAGDSFDSGFLHEYLQGGDLAACLAAGNLAELSRLRAREELKRSRRVVS